MRKTVGTPAWAPRWYLWDGGFLAVGRSSGVVPPHAHHAVQISLAIEGDIRVAGADGEWHTCRGAVVRPDVVHSFSGEGVDGAMLFVDPESIEGQWLRSSLPSDITLVPERRLDSCLTEMERFSRQPLEAMEVAELIRHCVNALCTGAPPSRRLDPRVSEILAFIRSAEDLRITLDAAAARVFLSPGRFAHLFTRHVGLPFRRYLLWRKLSRALVTVGRGRTLTEAAHAAGFADAAHFSRTCNEMFGIPPSVLLRGEFFEIAPPFAVQQS